VTDLRHIYAQKALSQISRLLSNQDRNPFSPTYGCFHRDYWLDKTSDFPDAVRQFAVHALALVYRHEFPGSIYHKQPKIRDWAIAGLDYWARLQHADGSFDEFYPYERGWVGPTAFTTFTSIEALRLLQHEMPDEVAGRVRAAISKAAHFITAGETEEDHLANHHAMACLAVWKAAELLDDPTLKAGYARLWQTFLTYCHAEGWAREYDGVDPGYLSATVSFLAKIYQTHPDPAIREVMQRAVEFSSYFVYPNGFYGGSMGSRNTLHFYAHGYEVVGSEIPLAAAIAEKMLQGLAEEKLVPPEIISDRYVVYRVPEFLQAYLDYTERPTNMPLLPYEQEPFTRYFPGARVFVATTPQHYTVANLAKGGVVKVFDRQDGRLLLNDCGLIGELIDGQVVTSQWVDPAYRCEADAQSCTVSGHLHAVPSHKLFTPFKHILFRGALVALGWNPAFSHALKGTIRKTLMLGRRPVPIQFRRVLHLEGGTLRLVDELRQTGGEEPATLRRLSVGDEFFVRYVPQSRYFQNQELEVQGYTIDPQHLAAFNGGHRLVVEQAVTDSRQQSPVPTIFTSNVNVRRQIDAGQERHLNQDEQVIYWEGQRKRRDPTDPIIQSFVQPKIDFMLRHISLPPDGRILDVGCGNGYFTHYFDHYGNVVGVDYASAMLAMHPGSRLVQASAFELPFETGSFDVVFCSNLLHHVPDPVAVVGEMKRVSRRYVVIHEPNRNNPAMLALGLVKAEERQSLQFTPKYVRSLADHNGLHAIACESLGFITPNRMPAAIARQVGAWNAPHPLAAYTVLIAQHAPE
jgi:SAM-dependent methyltransferase